MQDAEGDYYQQFRFEYVSNGYYKVTSVGSGMCLDDNNRGTEPGANIHQWTPKEGEPAQLWQPVPKGGYYYLTPQCAPGLVADVEYAEKANGTNVSLWVPKGGAHQLFELIPVRVITGVAVDPEEMTLVIDEAQTVNAVITPSAAKDKTVMWSSSAPQIATVNGNGKVTGMKVGKAVITATTIDCGLKASCTVTVEDQPTLILGSQQIVEEGIYWIKMSKESPGFVNRRERLIFRRCRNTDMGKGPGKPFPAVQAFIHWRRLLQHSECRIGARFGSECIK